MTSARILSPENVLAPGASGRAVIGPNAVTRLFAALGRAGLGDVARDIYLKAGVREWLDQAPTAMVDEIRVAKIHQGVRDALPPEQARAILVEAGTATADYLLANRIPAPFRRFIAWTPRGMGLWLFLAAIRRHAWTFVGTGRFTANIGAPTTLEIRGNPFCAGERRAAPVCDWHAAVFERLFGEMIHPSARVREVACEARGDECCRFTLKWSPLDADPATSARWDPKRRRK